ncbi:FliH/SctL family protein, partial [Vibrio parahaemolyticus]
KAVELASEEENVLVQMNPEQVEFIELLRQQTNREFEFLKKLRLEPNASIKAGGCVVETNYGEVDARIETRLQQLWVT